MQKSTYLFKNGVFNTPLDSSLDSKNTLVLCFGSTDFSHVEDGFNQIVSTFPNSIITGNSTSGEIYEDALYEHTLSIVVMKFMDTKIKVSTNIVNNMEESFGAGESISNNLSADNLKSIFILSDGMNINGSKLTKGINHKIKNNVVITGGLAGDDANFTKTWVISENKPKQNIVVAVGLYGDNINVAHGSQGGWKQFGITRKITSSKDNIVYEIDNKPALEVYKTYLGDSVKDLPASGLLFPLMIEEDGSQEHKVRTIFSVDEDEQSIAFVGDMPQGSTAMFMKASFSELIDGASEAASKILISEYKNQNAVNIAISCVGRKLVLGQKTEDEIEAVYDTLGDNVSQVGYYSYGEISPLTKGTCDLHNQTMTLTLIWES